MTLKTHNYLITVSSNNLRVILGSSFVIKAVKVNEEQAQKIAEILFPEWENVRVVSIKKEVISPCSIIALR